MFCADSVVVAGHRVADLSRRRKLERLAVAERRHAHARRVESCIWNESIEKEYLKMLQRFWDLLFQLFVICHFCAEF